MQSFSPYGGDIVKCESEGRPSSPTIKLEGMWRLKAEHMKEGLLKVVARVVVETMHEPWTPGRIDQPGRYPSLVLQLPLVDQACHHSKQIGSASILQVALSSYLRTTGSLIPTMIMGTVRRRLEVLAEEMPQSIRPAERTEGPVRPRLRQRQSAIRLISIILSEGEQYPGHSQEGDECHEPKSHLCLISCFNMEFYLDRLIFAGLQNLFDLMLVLRLWNRASETYLVNPIPLRIYTHRSSKFFSEEYPVPFHHVVG